MGIDLRKKPFRKRKFYWRAVREGSLPWPRYKKPKLTAIDLDPKQAIITQCRLGGIFMNRTVGTALVCAGVDPGGANANCPESLSVRGRFSEAGRFYISYDQSPS